MLTRNLIKLLVLTLILALAVSSASAAIFKVKSGGDPAVYYHDLASALTAAGLSPSPPHTVQVFIGTADYSDADLTLPTTVTQLICEAGVKFISPAGTHNFLDLTNASALTVQDIYIEGYQYAFTGTNCDNGIFRNIIFVSCDRAFNFNGADGNLIEDCQISDFDHGLVLSGGGGNTIQDNTIFDGVNYGIYITGATAANTVTSNCIYNASNPGGFDDNGIYYWSGNYFDDYSGSGWYALDGGGAGSWDTGPNTYNNSAVAATTTWEYSQVYDVDFNWTIAKCNPQEEGLAAYNFTVNFDPTKLQYMAGTAGYDHTLLGEEDALYTDVVDSSSVGKLIFTAANYTEPGFGSERLAFAQFKAITTGAASITISSTYLDKNNNPLITQSTPLNLTLQDTQCPDMVSLTHSGDLGDDVYSDPSGNIKLYLEASATDNLNLNRIRYRFDGTGGWITLAGPFSGTSGGTTSPVYINISGLTAGIWHYVKVYADDDAGNPSCDTLRYDFFIDRTGPGLVAPYLVPRDPDGCGALAGYTNNTGIKVDLYTDGSADISKMEFYRTTWEGPITFANPADYLLPSGDATHGLYVRLYDKYGNMGGQQGPVSIILDQTLPTPSGWILAGGAAKTNTTSIIGGLASWGGTDVVKYKWSESSTVFGCNDPGWISTAVWPINVTLSAAQPANKKVYFATMDQAGNVSALLNDEIYLDQTAPVISSIVVTDVSDGQEDCSDSWTVNVTVAFTAADIKYLHLSKTSGSGYTNYDITGLPSPVTVSYTISGGISNAVNIIYATLEDDITNVGPEVSDGIFIDRNNPSAGTMALDGGATFSADATVNVTLSGMSTDIMEVIMTVVSGNYTGCTWVPFDPLSPTVTYTFAAPVDQSSNTLYLKARDCSGRESGEVSDAIVMDLTAPVINTMAINGGAARTNNKNVSVTYTWTENWPSEIMLSEDPGFAGASWQPHGSPVAFVLSDNEPEVKTVYMKMKDAAGNVGPVIHDDIELDMTGPTIASIVIKDASDGEEDCTDSWTVDVTVSYADIDVKWLGLSTTSGSGYTWIDVSAMTSPVTVSYTISGGSCDALNTIYAILYDDLNNAGTEDNDDILVDCNAPSAGTMALDNGATWSLDGVVDVYLSGMDADIVEVRMTEISGDYSGAKSGWRTFDPLTPVIDYDFGTPTETYHYLYLEARDCAGHVSTEVSDYIYFDLTNPVVNTISINSGATKTNNRTVSIAYTFTETYPSQVMLAEDDAFTGASWQAHPVTSFNITSPNDGTKKVYIKMKDQSGRVSTAIYDDIVLDETPPTGSFTIVSGNTNPIPAAGYTRSQGGNWLQNITYSGDALQMRFRNSGGGWTAWTGVASSYPSAWSLTAGEGTKTVQVQFLDDASNIGGPYNATIIFDQTAPAAPATFVGTPGGSLQMEWAPVTGAYKYMLRYTLWNDYPKYDGAQPPHPATPTEGHEAAVVTAPVHVYDFAGPQPDIYAFSVFAIDSAGNYSVANQSVFETNYILGDFDANGEVNFTTDFFQFANAYYSVLGGLGWDEVCDIGPTDDGTGTGYPIPDEKIDFYDLIPFAMNYDHYGAAKILPGRASQMIFSAELPERLEANAEYTISIMNNDPANLKGFHLIFNYDNENLEIVNVAQGKMFNTSEKTFFFQNVEGKELLIDGIIFGSSARFADNELATVTFRARNDVSRFDLKDIVLVVRDIGFNEVPATFATTVVKGTNPAVPTDFALSQNYPNPFNPMTSIELSLPMACDYRLDIFNVVGQKVKSFSGFSEAGIVTINWDASEYTSGVYFYRMNAGSFTTTKKMVLVK
jgi:parallel beta-helix repeat protein